MFIYSVYEKHVFEKHLRSLIARKLIYFLLLREDFNEVHSIKKKEICKWIISLLEPLVLHILSSSFIFQHFNIFHKKEILCINFKRVVFYLLNEDYDVLKYGTDYNSCIYFFLPFQHVNSVYKTWKKCILNYLRDFKERMF